MIKASLLENPAVRCNISLLLVRIHFRWANNFAGGQMGQNLEQQIFTILMSSTECIMVQAFTTSRLFGMLETKVTKNLEV